VSELLQLLLIGTILAVIGVLAWWLLIASEGVYLGRRVVILLYDLYARRYDGIKNYAREYEHMFLAQPIMEAVSPNRKPLILDVATGTGRLPLAMVRHGNFQGRAIGVDLSRKMLQCASENIYPYEEMVDFIWSPAENLPFADDTFDVVTCLEALEFMADPKVVLREMVRVLRPGGLLLTTQRQNTKLMPGKTWTSSEMQSILGSMGIENAKAQVWQVDYRKVWGKKAGQSTPTGAKKLDEILRCPRCKADLMKPDGQAWRCENCGGQAKVGADRVIELFPLYR
jgi:ubiquinone/menaquinone biosynthesis C-methylase UbiE